MPPRNCRQPIGRHRVVLLHRGEDDAEATGAHAEWSVGMDGLRRGGGRVDRQVVQTSPAPVSVAAGCMCVPFRMEVREEVQSRLS